uniref:AlNc14C104G6143 protein n=1 Tax=Albugo laibachii Nc14 TaxID=890382 RepID=F0WHT6_9STRA|nr:AlNc14C104G6143 [Albugo laibachii Nc14]|eukprot:CCA20811.1 AlNc14C104G6143 [Albugo laibachii Nc14]
MVLDQVRSSFGALPDHQQIATLKELHRLSQQTRKTARASNCALERKASPTYRIDATRFIRIGVNGSHPEDK